MRSAFFTTFGRSLTWWLTLILILVSVHIFEVAVATIRSTLFTTDEDVFQALERDPDVKRRFEEASAEELQQGWERGGGEKRKDEVVKGVVERLRVREEERREEAVREMLRNREERGGEGNGGKEATIGREMEGEEVDRILSRGFGRVREE